MITDLNIHSVSAPAAISGEAIDMKASKADFPLVTAIIPCRNELGYIDKCIESLISSDYPKDSLEVIVADGMSEDGTREVIVRYSKMHSWIRLLDNPKRILASGWNVGIKAARGDIIVALNAHGVFSRTYISRCVEQLRAHPELDCVGGVVMALPKDDGLVGKAICLVLSNPFGVGNSHFRTGSAEPRLADTVAFGGYRREVFERVGLFNEELTRSQDMELHRRLEAAGCRILLDPSMRCEYFTRSRLSEFLRYSFLNGFWVTYPLRFAAVAIRLRHIVPLLFVLSLLVSGLGSIVLPRTVIFGMPLPPTFFLFAGILASYLAANIYHSLLAAVSRANIKYAVVLPFLFGTLHVAYGFGSLWGLLRAALSRRFWSNLHKMIYPPHRKLNIIPQGR